MIFINNPSYVFLSLASFSLAFLSIYHLRAKSHTIKEKTLLIYSHLIFLFFPFALFTLTMACRAISISCEATRILSYSMPTSIALSLLAGFIGIPVLYFMSSRTSGVNDSGMLGFVKKHSDKISIRTPKLYVIDTAKPQAFSFLSFMPSIFMSVGILDILNRKEIESVILHELAHIKHGSTVLKISSYVMRLSPFSMLKTLSSELDAEERNADLFVFKTQKTWKYIQSAKRKLDEYETENNSIKQTLD